MFELQAQLSERRVENFAQTQRGRMTGGRLGVPDDVEDHILERWILVVTMSAPARVADVHFNVAGDGSVVSKLNHSLAEVRSAFHAAEAGMQHAHALDVERGQLIAAQALMLPDGLKKLLRRCVWRIAQSGCQAVSRPPQGVKVVGIGKHLELLLRWASRKVKRRNVGNIGHSEKPNAFRGFQHTDEFDEQNQIEPMAQCSVGVVCVFDGGL